MASVRHPKPGTVLLGKYRVDSVVGEGGMGAVVKAWHLDLEESVALKILLPEMMDRPEIVARFMREAKAAVKLKGEHVARVLDVGKLDPDADGNFDGVPYIAMEFLEGADLNQIIRAHGPQDPAMAVDLLLQACEAIAEAHSLGIIHRDIKASNFFITQAEGQPPLLKVLDFGIATPPRGTSDLTDGESVIGTPAYMAPEQMRSSRQADTRSDIWSLGVVLYEMLEGDKPFRSQDYADLCLKVGMDPPEPMVQPNVTETLRAVVMTCLEKPVERRYQSVAELAFDLLPFAADPVHARASAETTARLLTRRSTRSFDMARAPDDVTPAPSAPKRLTPVALPIQRNPLEDSHPSGLTPAVGMPPADPQLTPTSNGQVALPTARAPKRGLAMALSFVIVGGIAGGGVLLFAHKQPAQAPAAQPPPATTTEMKVIDAAVPDDAAIDASETHDVMEGSAAVEPQAGSGSSTPIGKKPIRTWKPKHR